MKNRKQIIITLAIATLTLTGCNLTPQSEFEVIAKPEVTRGERTVFVAVAARQVCAEFVTVQPESEAVIAVEDFSGRITLPRSGTYLVDFPQGTFHIEMRQCNSKQILARATFNVR
ncbi:MAG: hypothetical protein HC933_12430 [Pleurocapsa sp. SU_196_0]|nr:hypothetical protein [Pleurocapsa sp. SU_196_0]